MTGLNLTPKFNYITILCKVREILSIYRRSISFYENNQSIQGWNPTTTIKIELLKLDLMICKNLVKTITNNYLA